MARPHTRGRVCRGDGVRGVARDGTHRLERVRGRERHDAGRVQGAAVSALADARRNLGTSETRARRGGFPLDAAREDAAGGRGRGRALREDARDRRRDRRVDARLQRRELRGEGGDGRRDVPRLHRRAVSARGSRRGALRRVRAFRPDELRGRGRTNAERENRDERERERRERRERRARRECRRERRRSPRRRLGVQPREASVRFRARLLNQDRLEHAGSHTRGLRRHLCLRLDMDRGH